MQDIPWLEFIIRFQQFSGFALLAGQITGISLTAMNASKKRLQIAGPTLVRMNWVTVSAWTVHVHVSSYVHACMQVCQTLCKVDDLAKGGSLQRPRDLPLLDDQGVGVS